jgi:hypothetical protein
MPTDRYTAVWKPSLGLHVIEDSFSAQRVPEINGFQSFDHAADLAKALSLAYTARCAA